MGERLNAALEPDLHLVFNMAPVGLCVLRQRIIQCCNQAFLDMFGYVQDELVGVSMQCLYPSADEFVHIGELGIQTMLGCGKYNDERIMRRKNGHLFWCHSHGQSLHKDNPFGCTVWMFEDISDRRPVIQGLTMREREIAQHLVEGKTSKQIGQLLGISHRTIESYRIRMMRKLQVKTPTEMVSRLARQA